MQQHYSYFSSLERTITGALSFYLLLLAAGALTLAVGFDRVWNAVTSGGEAAFFAVVGFLVAYGALYVAVARVPWLGRLHLWLDSRFFGFLKKSNDIIFQAVVRILEADDQDYIRDLHADERYSMIHSMFQRLADNYRLFDEIMKTGIFRAWIWYWVMNYGTFTFSLLTVAIFSMMLGGSDPAARTMFTVCWWGALLHLGINVVLGLYLTAMTRRVSESIVLAYKPQILSMLRETIER